MLLYILYYIIYVGIVENYVNKCICMVEFEKNKIKCWYVVFDKVHLELQYKSVMHKTILFWSHLRWTYLRTDQLWFAGHEPVCSTQSPSQVWVCLCVFLPSQDTEQLCLPLLCLFLQTFSTFLTKKNCKAYTREKQWWPFDVEITIVLINVIPCLRLRAPPTSTRPISIAKLDWIITTA